MGPSTTPVEEDDSTEDDDSGTTTTTTATVSVVKGSISHADGEWDALKSAMATYLGIDEDYISEDTSRRLQRSLQDTVSTDFIIVATSTDDMTSMAASLTSLTESDDAC